MSRKNFLPLLAAIILMGAGLFVPAEVLGKKMKDNGYVIEYGKIIATGDKPVVVDLYADWCGPCRISKPVFNAVKDRMHKKAVFISINIEEYEDLAGTYYVRSIPTTLLIKPDGSVDRHTGLMNEEELEEFVKRNL